MHETQNHKLKRELIEVTDRLELKVTDMEKNLKVMTGELRFLKKLTNQIDKKVVKRI